MVIDEALGITGQGDAPTKKEALKIACISAEYQLHALNLVSCLPDSAN
jgi:hypothetical protein